MTPKSAPVSDAELMRAYLDGDVSAFDTIYRRHSGKVYGYLRKRLQNRETADEVFQATFFKLHQSRSLYDFSYPFTQWLFVITKTTLLDHYRKLNRQVPLSDEEFNSDTMSQSPPPQTFSEEKELEALNKLSSDQKQAIEMRIIDELSYEEIANRLKRSQQSIRQMVSRGLKKLRLVRGST